MQHVDARIELRNRLMRGQSVSEAVKDLDIDEDAARDEALLLQEQARNGLMVAQKLFRKFGA